LHLGRHHCLNPEEDHPCAAICGPHWLLSTQPFWGYQQTAASAAQDCKT
jgi:hypothetical protein